MKTIKTEQVFGSFFTWNSRLKKIEEVTNHYLSMGFILKESYSLWSKKLLIFPIPTTVLVFEIDNNKQEN